MKQSAVEKSLLRCCWLTISMVCPKLGDGNEETAETTGEKWLSRQSISFPFPRVLNYCYDAIPVALWRVCVPLQIQPCRLLSSKNKKLSMSWTRQQLEFFSSQSSKSSKFTPATLC